MSKKNTGGTPFSTAWWNSYYDWNGEKQMHTRKERYRTALIFAGLVVVAIIVLAWVAS